LALEVPSGGNIVEIGAYQGRSSICLGLGAKEAGATVYSIDHHPTYEAGGTLYSMADNQMYYTNIAKYGVGDVIKTINLPSDVIWQCWLGTIALLFIDGNHEYEHVSRDFNQWSVFTDIVALHDTANDYHPGVIKLVKNILASGEWQQSEIVDSLSVFRRVE